MYLIWEYGVYTNGGIGNLFHVTYSSVSRNILSLSEKLIKKNAWKKLYNKIKSQIKNDTIDPCFVEKYSRLLINDLSEHQFPESNNH
jgi:hypothetical protein